MPAPHVNTEIKRVIRGSEPNNYGQLKAESAVSNRINPSPPGRPRLARKTGDGPGSLLAGWHPRMLSATPPPPAVRSLLPVASWVPVPEWRDPRKGLSVAETRRRCDQDFKEGAAHLVRDPGPGNALRGRLRENRAHTTFPVWLGGV